MDAQTPTPPPAADDDGGGMLPPIAKLKLLLDIRLDQMPLVDRLLLALEAVPLAVRHEIRHAGHRPVGVHDLADHARGIEPGKP